MVQRYLTLSTMKKAKFSVLLYAIGTVLFISLCCFSGLVVYSTYANCDPVQSKRIVKYDQVLPLFVLEIAGNLHGVPGLFVAGVFGAALSSLSVALNSTAIVLLEDFLRGMCQINLTERKATIITKSVTIALGFIAVGLMFVVQRLGGVLEMTIAFTAISAGTMFGIFSLGMLVPWANTTGAIGGAFAGFLMSSIVSFGTQFAASSKMLVSHSLPVSVDKCEEMYGLANVTIIEKLQPDESKIFFLFKLSYLWITPIGFVTVMVVGVILSFVTGKTDIRSIDPELISPVCQWLLPEEAQNYIGTAVKKVEHQRLLANDKEVQVMPKINLDVIRGPEYGPES